MDTDDDLATLILKNDHWNILRYIRIHKLHESELVLYHGSKILFTITTTNKNDTTTNTNTTNIKLSHRYSQKIGYYTILEQVCLAALDCCKWNIAELCLLELEKDLNLIHNKRQITNTIMNNEDDTASSQSESPLNVVSLSSTSIRYQLLRGRYYEAIGDINQGQQIYTTLMKHNPTNTMAWKRLYCINKSKPYNEINTIQSLNDSIENHTLYNDSSVWYELYIQYKNIGQWEYAIYSLHHVLYIMSSTRLADTINLSLLHCEIAECYVSNIDTLSTKEKSLTNTTSNSNTSKNSKNTNNTVSATILETIGIARKHMATALELHPSSLRAKFGLIVISNMFLLYAEEESGSKSNSDTTPTGTKDDNNHNNIIVHEMNVSKELIKYSAKQIMEGNNNTTKKVSKGMGISMQALVNEYTDGL